MEGRVREHDIHRHWKLELDEVLAEDRRSITECVLGVGDHRGSGVDPVDPAPRHAAHELGRDPAGAAARVQQDLVASERQARQLLEGPSELGIGDAVVGGRMPSLGMKCSQRGRDRAGPLTLALRRGRSAPSCSSVSAMSSRPFSSRCLMSGSISNRAVPRPASAPPDPPGRPAPHRLRQSHRNEVGRAPPEAARSWCSWSGRCRRSSGR